MKNILQPLLVIALTGLVLYQSFFQRSALKEARDLTHQLHTQLDTLRIISQQYEATHQHYLEVHRQLLHSQHRATHLSSELSLLAMQQQTEVKDIQQQLRDLLAYDRQSLLLPSHSIDSLLFQP